MAHAEHEESSHHHIIPKKILFRVFGGLVFLTVLTVVVAHYVELGPLNLPVALGIAGAKSALVVTFFMALKYDSGVNSLVFTIGAVFVTVFLAFTLLDTTFRGDLGNVDPVSVTEHERRAEEMRAAEPADSTLRIAPADYANPPAGTQTRDTAPGTASDEGTTTDGSTDTETPDEGSAH